MTNPRVLLEYVSLVRRVLAASNDPDVASVGRLGEIEYLVDQQITQAELEVLDALMESPEDWRPFRDAIEPYVGKTLLKIGLQSGLRSYEIYIDSNTEAVVHLNGFRRTEAVPEELANATPSDQARWIFEHESDDSYGDGQRVVEVLLAGRNASDLSPEELLLLAKGYNWWGQHAKAFETAKLGIAHAPFNTEWFLNARVYLQNSLILKDLPQFLSSCDACIAEGIGPPAFWHLLKADRYIDIATGECELEDYEWMPGHPIVHPELLRPAADALDAALTCEPALREQEDARDWVGDWNLRFAAVLQDPTFGHLTQ